MVAERAHEAPEEMLFSVGEDDERSMDFATQLATGQTMATVTEPISVVRVTPAEGVGVVTPSVGTINGSKVDADYDITAANVGDVYVVTISIVTNNGKIKHGVGRLYVQA